MLSYIELINRFWQVDEAGSFSGNETRLYFYLLKVANKASWPAEFEHADKKTEGNVGLSKGTLKKCRDRLVEVGLVAFTEGGKGQGDKVRYQLRYQKLTPNLTPKPPVRYQKLTPNLTPKLDFSAGLVSVKVSKFNTYTIYKRLKTVYTLTKKSAREQLGKFLSAKKKVRSRSVVPRIKPGPPPRRLGDPATLKSDVETLNVPYSVWKACYRIDGNETQLRKLWLSLSDQERQTALDHTPVYMQSAPERFLKSPANYLADKQFNNKVINRHDKPNSDAPAPPIGSAQFGQGAVLGNATGYHPQRIGRRSPPVDGGAGRSDSGSL